MVKKYLYELLMFGKVNVKDLSDDSIWDLQEECFERRINTYIEHSENEKFLVIYQEAGG